MLHSRFHPLALLTALVTIGLSGCPTIQDNPDPVMGDAVVLTREHSIAFNPGMTVEITVEIDVREDVEISAIALVEEIPADWVYVSAEHALGLLPAIRPAQGAEGTLSFVWIQPPTFPYTFTYTLGTPLGASDTVNLNGHVEYRVGDGSAEFTGNLVSALAPS